MVHSHHTLALIMDSVRGSAILRDSIDLNPPSVQPRGTENEASCLSRRAPGAPAASGHASLSLPELKSIKAEKKANLLGLKVFNIVLCI